MVAIKTRPSTIVVGAGLAGLFCALELERHGFHVQVIESRGPHPSAGDFISIGPTALRGFKNNSPQLYERVRELAFKPEQTWYKSDGDVAAGPIQLNPNFGALITRPRLHQALEEAAKRAGIEVRYNIRSRSYHETAAGAFIQTADGKTLSADLIIAADGLQSKSWKAVTGRAPRLYSSGSCAYRANFKVADIEPTPAIRRKLLEGQDKLSMYFGKSSHVVLVTSPEIITYTWIHDTKDKTAVESWTDTIPTKEAMLNLQNAGIEAPELFDILRVTPDNTILDWPLIWRDLDEEWVSPHRRVVQIDDAAHPFLPTSVNGGTQALEDAISLGACLATAYDKLRGTEALSAALLVHNKLRFERVCCIQRTGLARKHAYRNVDWAAAKTNPALVQMAPPPWMTEHDPEVYVEENFDACLAALQAGEEFQNTNIPEGWVYKPMTMTELDPSLKST